MLLQFADVAVPGFTIKGEYQNIAVFRHRKAHSLLIKSLADIPKSLGKGLGIVWHHVDYQDATGC